MHVSTITALLSLATAALCENTTLADLVFENDDRKIARFIERTMPRADNGTAFAQWNATLRHALDIPFDRNTSRCAPLRLPRECSDPHDQELRRQLAMQRAVCVSGVSGASNYTVESGFQACTLQRSTNQTCAGRALECLQNLTSSHDPLPGLVEKWGGNQARSHDIRTVIIGLACAAVIVTLVTGVLFTAAGGLATGEVAGSRLSGELPWVFGRLSRARGAPRVIEIQFLGLDER